MNHQFVFADNGRVTIDGVSYALSDFHPHFQHSLTALQGYADSRSRAEGDFDRMAAELAYELHKAAVAQAWSEMLCAQCAACRVLSVRESGENSHALTTSAAASRDACPRWA